MKTRNYFGAMLVQERCADGMVCGLEAGFPETLRPLLRVIGTSSEYRRVAGLHLMIIDDEIWFFADTTVNLDPTAEEMAEIACLTADFAACFDLVPRVAMLSFSNFGSVRGPRADKVRRATELVRTWRPALDVEGEIHADVALLPQVARTLYPFSRLRGTANVLIFPSLGRQHRPESRAVLGRGGDGGADPGGARPLGEHPVAVRERVGHRADRGDHRDAGRQGGRRRDGGGGRRSGPAAARADPADGAAGGGLRGGERPRPEPERGRVRGRVRFPRC
jgi:hypothetical protein